MSQQKQNLLWLMIICYASCQITCSEKLIIEVDSTDQCFWDRSSSHPAITQTCLSYDDAENCHIMNVTLNISSQGQCRSYSLNIKQGGNYEIRMNGTVKNIKLWLLPDESNCLLSILDSPEIDNCQAQGGIMSISSRITQTVCQNIDPVDLRDTCRNALYDRRKCKEDEGNKYILSLNKNNDGTCVTCDNRPMFNLTTNVKDKDGYTDPSKASDALKDLKCEMEEMEKNVIKAAIVMGDVIGLLHVQAKNTETKDICYSSDEDMINVINCQSDLKAGFPWSVKIPSEAFDKSRQEHNGCAFVGILLFPNMGNKDETQSYTVLNNEVYGITMGANISNLTNNIDMFFTQSDQIGSASCVSWDGKGELNWTTSTCETEQINSNTIKCSCSHLMFFTVLMAPTDENVTPCLESLTFIIYIGCGIFMFFLFIALFMHFLLWKAKSNQATKILMNMFVALCLLNASFLSNESVANTQDNAACVFIALLLHYSMLASFTWFFIQALHMYLWLIRQNIITNYMRKITVLGWVCPAPIVIVIVSVGGYNAVILNATSGKITQMCWITNPYIHYTVNIGYYALVLIFMTGIFITILTSIVHARHIRSTDGKRKTFRKQLMLVLSLFLLFGLTWSVAFFSYGPTCIPLYYILFTVLNSFQGFFLFLYYYHIHNVVPGHFSDDPESTDYTTTFTQSSINVMENIQN